MKRFAFLAALLALVLVVGAILLAGGHVLSYFGPSALTGIFGLAFVLLLRLYSPAEMARAFQAVADGRPVSRQELDLALNFFETLRQLFAVLGPLAVLMGGIHMLEGLGMGSMEALGEGAAVALLGLLYSFGGLLLLAVPGTGAAQKKLAMLAKPSLEGMA